MLTPSNDRRMTVEWKQNDFFLTPTVSVLFCARTIVGDSDYIELAHAFETKKEATP